MDTWELPDGRVRGDFHSIVLPEYALAVPVTADGRAPAGGLQPGEDPLTAARRGLLEETGYTAEDWRTLGALALDGSTGCGRGHLFLARNATRVAAPTLDAYEDIEVVLLDEAALRAALHGGGIAMMPTACAVSLALLALGG